MGMRKRVKKSQNLVEYEPADNGFLIFWAIYFPEVPRSHQIALLEQCTVNSARLGIHRSQDRNPISFWIFLPVVNACLFHQSIVLHLISTAIDQHVPVELQDAVQQANSDDDVRVILLSGNGKGFCSGYDLKKYAEAERGTIGKMHLRYFNSH